MSDPWRVVVVVLAVAVVVEAIVMVGLMRQIGAVLLRLGLPRATPVEAGPGVGELVELPGHRLSGRPVLVVFTSSTCDHCQRLVPRLRWMHATYGPASEHGHQLDLVAVITDRGAESRARHARELDGFARSDLIGLTQEWNVPGTPFAVALDAEQRVRRAAVVHSPDELETLATLSLGLRPIPNGSSPGGGSPASAGAAQRQGGTVVRPGEMEEATR